jgi:hypothetical protein
VGSNADVSRSAGGAPHADREHLVALLQKLAEGIQPPPKDAEAVPTTSLIRGACQGLVDGLVASDLLARHAARCEANGVRVMALGFSLRRFERADGGAAALPAEFAARLRDADDPGDEAGVIAQELAGRMRVNRLIAVELEKQAAEASSVAAKPYISEATGVATEPGFENASPEFLSMFTLGSEAWEHIEAWARDTCRGTAAQRMRALLDAAGVDSEFEIERLVNRLDVDFYFRFGYALAACEEELSGAGS